MTTQPASPRPTVDQEAVRTHLHAAITRRTPYTLWTVVADVPVLLAELERHQSLLTWTRTEYANLLAVARATLAADRDGEPDPLFYLRDEIARQAEARTEDGR